jgi:DNA-binding IclR family transcriptional regulator
MASLSSSNAERAARVLIALGAVGSAGIALKELAEQLGQAKPAVHRTLTALARHGFVETIVRGRYRLGPSIYGLARQESSALDRIRLWRPALMEMAARFGHAVYLIGRAGLDAVVLDMHVGQAPVQALTSGVGGRLPLGVGPGPVAILSTLDEASRAVVLRENEPRYHARGLATEHIRRLVGEAVEQGFACDRGDFLPDCGGVALPVRDGDGTAATAVTVAAPLTFLTEDRIRDIVQHVGGMITTLRQEAAIA